MLATRLAILVRREYEKRRMRAATREVDLDQEGRTTLALLGRAAIEESRPDFSASLHDVLSLCRTSFKDWPLGALSTDDGLASVRLLTDQGVPTPDCADLVRGASNLADLEEGVLFARLMEQIKSSVAGSDRERVYSAVREFIVRTPVTTRGALHAFMTSARTMGLAGVLQNEIYQPTPRPIDGVVSTCEHCGSRLRRATGSCATPICEMRHGRGRTGVSVPWTEDLIEVGDAVLTFWVSPGLDECALYDEARALGRDAVLYDRMDACDVLIDGAIALDLKANLSPISLARRLNAGIGRLARYSRRIICIPDPIIVVTPAFIPQLRARLDPSLPSLEIMSSADFLKELKGA